MSRTQPERTSSECPRRPSAASTVYAALRESVLSMELSPNQAISRNALTEQYKVSQTPVREAILRLEQEGLVRTIPQSKTIVTRINVAQLREAHFLRTAIELEVARTLTGRADSAVIGPVWDILEQQRQIEGDSGQQAAFARLDRAFHDTLYGAAGQSGLADLVRERSGHLDRVRRLHLPSPGKMAAIVAEHAEILNAIANQDLTRAAQAVRKHLSGTLAVINRMIDADPDFFDLT